MSIYADKAPQDAEPDRFCAECGADIIGNDPHAPGCPEDKPEFEYLSMPDPPGTSRIEIIRDRLSN